MVQLIARQLRGVDASGKGRRRWERSLENDQPIFFGQCSWGPDQGMGSATATGPDGGYGWIGPSGRQLGTVVDLIVLQPSHGTVSSTYHLCDEGAPDTLAV